MKHGRRAQQQRRKYRNIVLQHPQNVYSYDELLGKTVDQLKEILETIVEA